MKETEPLHIVEYTPYEKDRLFSFYYALNMLHYLENAFNGECDQIGFQSVISGKPEVFYLDDILGAYRGIIIPDLIRSLRDMDMTKEVKEAIKHDRVERAKTL